MRRNLMLGCEWGVLCLIMPGKKNKTLMSQKRYLRGDLNSSVFGAYAEFTIVPLQEGILGEYR
jgi:hypothetical protein